jgi:hypothetical protein
MLLVVESANTDLPSIGFRIDWSLSGKYAVCQEILTKNWALQACFVKKP